MAAVKLGTKAIGSIVNLNVNGALREFIAIQHGKPASSLYDNAGWENATILLMKDSYENRQWHTSLNNSYSGCTIRTWLEGTFFSLIEESIRNAILQVKIPYRTGSSGSTVNSGANGLSAKVFFLSGKETGATMTTIQDGALLSYFTSGDMRSPICWSRSPGSTSNDGQVERISKSGSSSQATNSEGVRPAIAVPQALLVDDNGILTIDPTIKYVVEERTDNGIYKQIAVTEVPFHIATVPASGTYYQARVKAVNSLGLESAWATGTSLPINYNNPPEITGEDTDWGALTQPQSYDYTPSDPDVGNVLTVVEQITNGTEVFTLRAFTAESGKAYTADFSSVWMLLAKGSHALVITVDDGQGGEATRTITFSRPVQRIAASRAFSTDEPVTQALISVYPGLPADASLHLEVCNNPFDASPAWEDITAKVGKYVHAFEETEAVNGPGLAYRFTITPGAMPVHFDMAVIRFKHGGEEYVYKG